MLNAKQLFQNPYSVAILASLLALLLRFLLMPLLRDNAPLLVFIMPVMLSAWYGGLRAGLLATGLCALLGTYFFVPNLFSFSIAGIGNLVRVLIFLVEGVLISWLSEALHSAKQRAERTAVSLEASEEKYRLLVEGVQDYAIFGLNPQGEITSWNGGAEIITGYSAAAVLGRHVSLLYAETADAGNPPDDLQRILSAGRAEREGWLRRKNGTLFWANVVVTALYDEAGNLQGFSQVIRDFTARYQTEIVQRQLLKDLSDTKFAMDQAAILVTTDLNGVITSVNDKFCEVSQYSREELIGKTHRLVNSGYHPQSFFKNLWETITQGQVWQGEIKNRAKDGSYYWVDTTIVPYLDESEQPFQYYLAVRFDITARKQAEALLVQEKAVSDLDRRRLQAILDILPIGVLIADANGQILEMNAAFQSIWGKAAPIVEVGEYSQYKGWWAQTQKPIAADEWALARAIQRGETSINEVVDIETFDGERKTILNSAVPIQNELGEISNAVVVNVDITEQQQTEARLRRSAQRLGAIHQIDQAILGSVFPEAIAQAALDRLTQSVACDQSAILLVDFDAEQIRVLAGELAGDEAGTVVPIGDRFPIEVLKYRESLWYVPDVANLMQRPVALERQLAAGYHSFLAAALGLDGDYIGDLILVARQPDAFSVEAQETAQEVANQLAIAIQQSRLREQLMRYTTELEQRVAERTAALLDAVDGLEAFSYSASHDLRAPLRSMQGLSQALLEDYRNQLDATARLYIQEIAASARQADQLVTDLLDYGRLSRADMAMQEINLTEVVAAVLSQLEDELRSQQATVTVNDPLPDVIGHRPTLIQAILNLMTNAIKFVPGDRLPQVQIWAELTAQPPDRPEDQPADQFKDQPDLLNWVRLWIVDNGIGIAPEHQEQIFQSFERLHTTEEYPGTGVGLAIVRKGVERMGGTVGVVSEPGQGSQFWIKLKKASAVA